jgi:lipoprotein-anchoring transpeptidase ErfK/SrfK
MPATPAVPLKVGVTPKAEAPKVEAPAPAPARPLALSASGNPITDGRRLYDAGELVAARSILNSALAAGQLTGNDRDVARDLLTKISQQVIFGKRIFKDDPYSSAYTVQSGDRLARVAASTAVTWELLGRVNGIPDPRKVRALQTIKLVKGPFHATISKRAFVMDIYLGAPGGANSVYVMSFPVGLGKDDSTPLGTWQVQPQSKLKNPTYYSPRGEGIIAADDPKNPLGEFWIGLTGIDGHAVNKASYGIHGTIDPASIGKEESMGCIRMKNEDVAIVYELLVEGKSQVVVKE